MYCCSIRFLLLCCTGNTTVPFPIKYKIAKHNSLVIGIIETKRVRGREIGKRKGRKKSNELKRERDHFKLETIIAIHLFISIDFLSKIFFCMYFVSFIQHFLINLKLEVSPKWSCDLWTLIKSKTVFIRKVLHYCWNTNTKHFYFGLYISSFVLIQRFHSISTLLGPFRTRIFNVKN